MKQKNVLNLYAGLGGNRKDWTDVKVTAVEWDPEIAKVYNQLYPQDEMVIADAHEYLLQHYKDFDFIWTSPPCQTHSQIRYNIGYKADRKYKKVAAVYPDLKLYEEILLLENWKRHGMWVVESTIPYYTPLVGGYKKTGGHIWWSNFEISSINHGSRGHRGGTVESLQKRKGIDLSNFEIKNKRQLLRNCVEPEVGLYVMNCSLKQKDVNEFFLNY